jgi:hypothetical protein
MNKSLINRCRVVVEFSATTGYSSSQTFDGGAQTALEAFRELGRLLTIAGHGVEMLETAAEVKAAVRRDTGNNG